MKNVVIIGAGFNADAGPEVGTIRRESVYGPFEFEEAYPLVGDLAPLCYPEGLPAGTASIEDALGQAIEERRWDPVRRLCSALRRTDHYLIPCLLPSGGVPQSRYARFFDRFSDAEFVTFNYDSFVEAFLYTLGRWYPHDGYGPAVLACPSYKVGSDFKPSLPSASHVYHMHGSISISESRCTATPPDRGGIRWLRSKPAVDFVFEPGSNADLFFPWTRPPRPVTGFTPVEDRIIAPVPSKSAGLARAFVSSVRQAAVCALRDAEQIISIGYEFNPIDREVYEPLLDAISTPIHVICPDAESICDRLANHHRTVPCEPQRATFAQWVDAEFS